jgi:hypothetical protein
LRKLFHAYDTDGSGTIDMFEFAALLRDWGVSFSPHQFQLAMRQLARSMTLADLDAGVRLRFLLLGVWLSVHLRLYHVCVLWLHRWPLSLLPHEHPLKASILRGCGTYSVLLISVGALASCLVPPCLRTCPAKAIL